MTKRDVGGRLTPVWLALAAGMAAAQPQYTLQAIEFPEESAWMRDLNDAGQVPINAFDTNPGDHNAYVWQNGVLTPLADHPKSANVAAATIDENGVVYGEYLVPSTSTVRYLLPMRWVEGVAEDLPLASESYRCVVGRSSATTGHVVGAGLPFENGTPGWTNKNGWGDGPDAEQPFGGDDPWRAIMWGGGERRVLPRMRWGKLSRAMDVNDAGQVIVWEQIGSRSWSWLIDPERGIIDLGGLSGGVGGNGVSAGTSARAINEAGQIAGSSRVGFHEHAFLWEDGVMTDLGALPGFTVSEARDLNDKGDVVGVLRFEPGFDEDGAFLYTGGTMHDINDLVAPGSGWSFTAAVAINNNGQILVEERMTGSIFSRRYALLTPQ